jgi:hypothetical protein
VEVFFAAGVFLAMALDLNLWAAGHKYLDEKYAFSLYYGW